MNAPDPVPFQPEGPQALVRSNPPAEPYPVASLGPLRRAVEAAQATTKAPVALAAQSALSVASLAVQCHADVETLGGNAPTSLFCLSVARSGERKSATDKILMAGLRAFERDANHAYEAELADHVFQEQIWKVDRDAALSSLKKSKSDRTAAQADLKAVGAEPQAPLKPYLTASEPTLEGLHRLFAEGQPGLGVFSDEGGGFLGGYGMSRDNRLKTIAGLSDLWGGEPIRRVRAGESASMLYGRRLAGHLMVQPVAAAELLADPLANGQGFLARFLIAAPESLIGFRTLDSAVDRSALIAFEARLLECLGHPKPLVEGTTQELRPRVLPLSNKARALLHGYYEATEVQQRPGGQLASVTPFASKSPEQACRIAGVLTLWSDLQAAQVDAQNMGKGITLAQHYLQEATRVADAAIISQDTADAEKLRRWLLADWPGRAQGMGRNPQHILPSDILQRGPGGLRERKKIQTCLHRLVEAGWLTPLPEGSLIDGRARQESYAIVRGA